MVPTCPVFAGPVTIKEDTKQNKKTKEIQTKLCALISQKRLERFVLNLVCSLAYLAGISAANLVEFGLEILELHSCENQVLFLPVSLLTVWRVLAFWASRHSTVRLDYEMLITYQLLCMLNSFL